MNKTFIYMLPIYLVGILIPAVTGLLLKIPPTLFVGVWWILSIVGLTIHGVIATQKSKKEPYYTCFRIIFCMLFLSLLCLTNRTSTILQQITVSLLYTTILFYISLGIFALYKTFKKKTRP